MTDNTVPRPIKPEDIREGDKIIRTWDAGDIVLTASGVADHVDTFGDWCAADGRVVAYGYPGNDSTYTYELLDRPADELPTEWGARITDVVDECGDTYPVAVLVDPISTLSWVAPDREGDGDTYQWLAAHRITAWTTEDGERHER